VNSLPLESNQKIPKIIWQTAKSTPHYQSHQYIKSWIDKNPEYQWLFMDDVRCDQFIKDNFNQQFYDMYRSLPFGVMRADVWRVCVVYVYGGVYVDTDCECVIPLKQWINNHSLIPFNDSIILLSIKVEGEKSLPSSTFQDSFFASKDSLGYLSNNSKIKASLISKLLSFKTS
jgi:mannosyltransferase OCH1-like enzyme